MDGLQFTKEAVCNLRCELGEILDYALEIGDLALAKKVLTFYNHARKWSVDVRV